MTLQGDGFILIPPLVFDPEGSDPKGGRTDKVSVTNETLSPFNLILSRVAEPLHFVLSSMSKDGSAGTRTGAYAAYPRRCGRKSGLSFLLQLPQDSLQGPIIRMVGSIFLELL